MKRNMISVIVPIYNIQEYLPQCIDSIINQTYTELEIILVDDGSTDSGGSICDEYALNDSRVKVIHKKNGGLVSARKAGIRAAHGEYITFVDGDDWIERDTYEKILEIGQRADIITYACYEEYGDYRTVKENKLREGLYVTGHECPLYETMLMGNVFFEFGINPSLCTKLIRRNILTVNQENVSDLISYGEDAACTFPCLLDASTVYVSNERCYHYRQRQGSIVKSDGAVCKSNFQRIYHLMAGKIKTSFCCEKSLTEQLHYYMWFILLVKAYGHINTNMLIFPFSKILHGGRLAIYGAGGFGGALKNFCDTLPDVSVAGWSDLHYETYKKQGQDIICIDELLNLDFDYVVIAILNETIAKEVADDFIRRGVLEEKVDWVKKSVLQKTMLPGWITE